MVSRQIASALADGDDISWQDASRLAETPHERHLVENLKWISSVSAATTSQRCRTVPSFPLWYWWATWWATAQIVTGVTMLAIGRVHASRFVLPQLLLVVSFSAAGAMLTRGGAADVRSRWLALVYLLTSASFAHAFLSPKDSLVARVLSHVPVEALIPAALWRFAQVFPRTERLSTFDRIVGRVSAFALASGLALIGVNVLILLAPRLVTTSLRLFGRDDGSWEFWAVVYPLCLSALIVPSARAFAASTAERNRVSLFAAALTGGMTPILLSGLVEQFAPGVAAHWTRSPVKSAAVDVVVLAALLLVPPATTYAILARHALPIRLVLERVTRHILARSSLVVLAMVPTALLGWFLFQHRAESLAVIVGGARGRSLSIWVAVSVAALLARRRALGLLDRVFQSGPVDYGQALVESISVLRGTAGITPVMGTLAERIHHVFGSATAILRIDDTTGAAEPLYGSARALARDSAILAVAREGEPVSFHGAGAMLDVLPEPDRAWVLQNGVEVVLSLKRPDGEMLALLAIGARRDRFPWSERDVAWLGALCDAAALAFANALGQTDRAKATDGDWQASECRACGAVQVALVSTCACGGDLQPALLPPLLHGKFAVERRIGRGGMGVVYQGFDRGLQRLVALKTLPHLDADAASQIRNEARAMGAVLHPNVATIFGIELWQRMPVLVLELLEGGTLADRLRHAGGLPVHDALELCRTLASALATLHRMGLIHGDLKPSNIGFTVTGTPKLLDFGLASLLQDAGSLAATEFAGTPLYLPPEIYEGEPRSTRVDLWALSVVLFETLAGVNPFAASSMADVKLKLQSAAAPDVRCWRTEIPDRVGEALQTCLHPRAECRPPTAEAWLDAFPALGSSLTPRLA